MAEKKSPVEKAGYIFLLGLVTYLWWKITSGIKRELAEG